MLKTLERAERTNEKALGLTGNGVGTQSHESAEQVYCDRHGFVKSVWGHCEECLDAGYRDWDATRVAKLLIPSWTGINVDGRQVIVAPVRDALEAVEKIGQYQHSNALVLIVWDTLVTALDKGKIGPNWVLKDGAAADDVEVECARCGQPFTPTVGDERVCEECWLAETGPPL